MECPNCGAEVAAAVKCWTVRPERYTAKGTVPAFRVGIFVCPTCKYKFRAKVNAKTKPTETNVKDIIKKLKEIHEGLTQTLRTLRKKIATLETERTSLLVEIEKLKKVAASRANALETEVNLLREELKSLRDLLDASEETA